MQGYSSTFRFVFNVFHIQYKQYYGEIKNELFFKERGPKSCFLNHLADSTRRRLKRKLLSIRTHKIKNENCTMLQSRVTVVSEKKCKWSVQLPGIDLAHEKNAIFVVTGLGVGRWPRPRY